MASAAEDPDPARGRAVPPRAGDPRPFELEPEPAPRPRSHSPADTPATLAAAAAPPVLERIGGDDGEARVVSTKTLKERLDPASRSRPGPLPPPPDWPREALRFPLRRKAPFLGALAFGVAADLCQRVNPFLGGLAWLLVTALHLQWQVRSVARTATGDDAAPALLAFGFEPAALRWAGLFLVSFAPALIAFFVPYLRDLSNPVRSPGETAFLVAAVAIPLAVLFPAAMLGCAFDDRSFARPLVALRWFLRGILPFLSVPVAWGVVALGHVANPAGIGAVAGLVGLSVVLRGAGLFALLVSARGLGVLGRRYEV